MRRSPVITLYVLIYIIYAIMLSLVLYMFGVNESNKSEVDTKREYRLDRLPQEAKPYLLNKKDNKVLLESQEKYDEKYYEPWGYDKPKLTKGQMMWPYANYKKGDTYGSNLRKIDKEWYEEMKKKGEYDKAGTINKKAITLRYVSLRNFPTNSPVFRDPRKGGEGYPFDYMQNTGVHPNEPIFVSHLSEEGEWAYVITSYAAGWALLRDIAYVSEKDIKSIVESEKLEFVEDGYAIKDISGSYVMKSRIGMRLSLVEERENEYEAIGIKASLKNEAILTNVIVPKTVARTKHMKINKENLSKIVNLMLKETYGWGGIDENRDCSATLKDTFAPFGIWLPRNSSQQSNVGEKIELGKYSNIEKKKQIIAKAIPFETLLYKKGHILLYLGEYNGEIVVMHNAWGIKTIKNGESGRLVIGKVVISSLNMSKDLSGDITGHGKIDKNYNMLSKITSMNIVTRSTSCCIIN